MTTPTRKTGKAAPPIDMTTRHRQLLTNYANKRQIPHHHKQRVNLLLGAAKGASHHHLARQFNTTVNRVKRWRNNWTQAYQALLGFEQAQGQHGLSDQELLLEMLKRIEDAPRSGAPVRIQPAQKAQIVALACEDPADYGLPHTVWSHQRLQAVIVQKAIVNTLHPRTVGKILKNPPTPTPQK
jgi:putative transposase